MTPEEWRRVKDVLEGALERPESERPSYIAEACGPDVTLRSRVEALARAAEGEAGLLDAPHAVAGGVEVPEAPTREGERIGAYELVEEIARGGMGVVYLARRADDEFQKRVAVKLMRPGLFSDVDVRRFRSERQIAAALDHPNIARLLDGGTTAEGEPYFVMEYVEGRPLLDHCRTEGVPLRERLSLFREICATVQYAHQRLVVHRDLKPGNILVTPEGSVRLLDFGIAKLLSPEADADGAERTATIERILTPEYASPEQVRGQPVTTASDVYSLGVILYELIADEKPYRIDTTDPATLLRFVCEQDPDRPSTRSPGLSGDLDAIVLKAMRKEPEQRYASAAALSEDVGRYLDGLPVEARRGSTAYRARKFVRRHRVGAAATALVLVALTGGILATLSEARRARAAEARAERRFDDVRRLANSFLFEFHDAIKNLPGSTEARRLLVQKGLEYLDSLSAEAGQDPKLLRDLAGGYFQLGLLQGSPGAGSAMLGDMPRAEATYARAADLWRKVLESPGSGPADRLELARVYGALSSAYTLDGKSDEAIASARRSAAILAAIPDPETPGDPVLGRARADTHIYLGSALKVADRLPDAVGEFRLALSAYQDLCARAPRSAACGSVGIAWYKIGALEQVQEHREEAVEAMRKAVLVFEGLNRDDPRNGAYQRQLGLAYRGLGELLVESTGSANAQEAVELIQKACDIQQRLVDADPSNPDPRIWLADEVFALGRGRLAAGDVGGGRRELARSVEILVPILASDRANVSARLNFALTCSTLGISWRDDAPRNPGEARRWLEKARDAYLDLRREQRLSPLHEKDLASVRDAIASLGP